MQRLHGDATAEQTTITRNQAAKAAQKPVAAAASGAEAGGAGGSGARRRGAPSRRPGAPMRCPLACLDEIYESRVVLCAPASSATAKGRGRRHLAPAAAVVLTRAHARAFGPSPILEVVAPVHKVPPAVVGATVVPPLPVRQGCQTSGVLPEIAVGSGRRVGQGSETRSHEGPDAAWALAVGGKSCKSCKWRGCSLQEMPGSWHSRALVGRSTRVATLSIATLRALQRRCRRGSRASAGVRQPVCLRRRLPGTPSAAAARRLTRRNCAER